MVLLALILGFSLLVTAVVALLMKLIFRSVQWKTINKILIIVPFSLFFLIVIGLFIHAKINAPAIVHEKDLPGDYIIDRNCFKGENADWQYDHYWMSIQDDTLYLNIMNNDELIKTYKRKIIYIENGKHTFIRFYDKDDFFNTEDDSIDPQHQIDSIKQTGVHEMLKRNPLPMYRRSAFRILLQSERFGTMFFIKGKWEPREKNLAPSFSK